MGWRQDGYEIILLIDANEVMGKNPGGISRILGKTGLYDILQYKHPHEEDINTHVRGTKQIDYIFGTDLIPNHCHSAGILPFRISYQSDHKALFVEINLEGLMKTKITWIDRVMARNLMQATRKERTTFLERADIHFLNHNLYQHLQKLTVSSNSEWGADQKREYEKWDEQMLAAEKQTKKTTTTSWSPKFAKAIAAKAFWKIGLSLKMTHTHPSKKFEKWVAEMGSEFKEIDIAGAKKELRTAQRELNKIERNADNLRNEHLRSLLTQAELNGDELQQDGHTHKNSTSKD
jgi:hypothetical protein